MMVFCNFLEIKAETKKVKGVKVVSFKVLYSFVKFRRLKMGNPAYSSGGKINKNSIFIPKIRLKSFWFCANFLHKGATKI